IGVLIDASIVMVENGYRHLSEHPSSAPGSGIVLSNQERRNILLGGAKQVGPAIFFSLLVILVSFLPVFLLEAQEGRMFRPLAWRIGSQFMPPLYEGSSLYMPTALPGISITQASALLQEQDRIIKSFPEVESVFGAVGRSNSPTDNAPLDMYDTTIMLKPREQWRPRMTYEKLIREMDEKLQFPGLTNTWT